MDPTSRKPKPSPSANTAAAKDHRHPHPTKRPLPDPTAATPPSTIQTISHRFSKLYTNHKKVISHSSTKPPPASPTRPEPPPHIMHHSDKVNQPAWQKRRRYPICGERLCKEAVFEERSGNEMKGRHSLSSIPPSLNGGRRRSFCSSHLELANIFSCSGVKVVAVDMPPFMQIHAVNCARKALDSLEKFTSKTQAFTLKKEFDGVYGLAWHCIVGTSFGSFVTHSIGGFMYFSMDEKLYILLFKTVVQRAE